MDKVQTRKFKSFQRKVRKKYPNAKVQMNSSGMFYISSGIGTVVGEELFIPPQSKVYDVWYWASRSCQIEQHFNRTHPLKQDMKFDEKKFDRISRRNRKKN
jgi:hypothetical protein